MSKRKTRKQKQLADIRRKLQISQPMVALPAQEEKTTSSISHNNYAFSYSPKSYSVTTHAYLSHDLSKTAIVTAAIVITQIVLFIMLKNHAIPLPNITY